MWSSTCDESVLRAFLRFSTCSAVLVLLNLATLTSVQCLPVKRITKRSPPIYDNVLTYLSTYGYLPQSDLETGNLRTDDQLKDAIKTLQSYGNIPVTGKVDAKTLELLKRPRCGMADVQLNPYSRRRKRYTLHGGKWPSTNLTWSLQSKNLQLNSGLVRLQLTKALDVWAKHSILKFRETSSDSADILVYFERGYHGDGFPFDGRGQVLAHAFFPSSGRGGDAHFDEQELWIVDESDESHGTSLFAVAAHEFGHSLGLAHSSVSGALMYPWYQGLKANFELPDDDREAIQRLYGPPETARHDRYPPYRPETPAYNPKKYNPPSVEPPKYYPRPPPPTSRPSSSPPRIIPSAPTTATTSTRRIPTPRTHYDDDVMPDTCDTSYDAISVIRRELFIFKGKYFWRIGDRGLYMDYPNLITNMWNRLPRNLTHIDAVYERFDRKIVFFIGREVYVFDAHALLNGYPKPLSAFGLPSSLSHIDAAMVWGHNSKTYFFSGSMYWRFDDEIQRVELDYPRDISIWNGISYPIDAAFQWKDGATYFFKGKGFWKFNDYRMRVTNKQPTPSASFWMGCAKALENARPKDHFGVPSDVYADKVSTDSSYIQINSITMACAGVTAIIVLIAVVTIIVKRRRKTHSYIRPKGLNR